MVGCRAGGGEGGGEGHLSWAGWFPLSAQIGWISDWLVALLGRPLPLGDCTLALALPRKMNSLSHAAGAIIILTPPPPKMGPSSAKSGVLLISLASDSCYLSSPGARKLRTQSASQSSRISAHLSSGSSDGGGGGNSCIREEADHMQIMPLRPRPSVRSFVRRSRDSRL